MLDVFLLDIQVILLVRLENEAVATGESPSLNSYLFLIRSRVWRTCGLPLQPSVEPESSFKKEMEAF